jgi:hypothetical protein
MAIVGGRRRGNRADFDITGGVRIDIALTQDALAHANEPGAFFSDKIFKPLPVMSRAAHYYTKGDQNRRPPYADTVRAPGSEAKRVRFTGTKTSVDCEEYCLAEAIPDEERSQVDQAFNRSSNLSTTLDLTELLQIEKDIDAAALINAITETSAPADWDGAGGTPLTDLSAAFTYIEATGHSPNTWFMSKSLGRVLKRNAQIIPYMQGWSLEALLTSGLPPIVNDLEIVEGSSHYISTQEGAAVTITPCFAVDRSAVLYIKPGPLGPNSTTFGATLDAPDQTTGGRNYQTRVWREDKTKSDVVEVSRTHKQVTFDDGCGYLYTDVIT